MANKKNKKTNSKNIDKNQKDSKKLNVLKSSSNKKTKNVETSKKTNTKKPIQPIKQVKKSESKKQTSKSKVVPGKKTSKISKSQVANTKKNMTTKKLSKNSKIVSKPIKPSSKKIRNINLPKRLNLEYYSCVRRNYLIENKKLKTKTKKRFWIVIGDGHKKYRKFETQVEAINYFRNLKKYAKMRVQSVETRDFIRSVYTLYEIIYRGFDISSIKKIKPSKKTPDNDNYVDEFSKFDIDDAKDKDLDFDENAINQVLLASEGDALVLDEDEKKPIEVVEKVTQKDFVTQLITVESNEPEKHEEQKIFSLDETLIHEEDPYAITNEVTFENEPNKNYATNSLYDNALESKVGKSMVEEEKNENLTSSQPVNNFNQQNNNDLNLDEDIELVQHQTDLNALSNETKPVQEINKFIFWFLVIFICLVLAAIVVVSILHVKGII